MLGRILRVLLGFVLAALAAGITKVLFVITPSQLANLPADVVSDRVAMAGEMALLAGLHSAIFAAPFALVGAAIGEWRRIRDWAYYALIGMAIALIGFLAQYSSEFTGQPTIVNNYALTAFLTTGFIAGIVYWIVSGRYAGGLATAPGMPTYAGGTPARAGSGPSRPGPNIKVANGGKGTPPR